jgi:hypothetical protein
MGIVADVIEGVDLLRLADRTDRRKREIGITPSLVEHIDLVVDRIGVGTSPVQSPVARDVAEGGLPLRARGDEGAELLEPLDGLIEHPRVLLGGGGSGQMPVHLHFAIASEGHPAQIGHDLGVLLLEGIEPRVLEAIMIAVEMAIRDRSELLQPSPRVGRAEMVASVYRPRSR